MKGKTDRPPTYFEAFLPARWRVFGRVLQPFCIAHRLLVQRLCPRVMTGQGITFDDVFMALAVCSADVSTLDISMGEDALKSRIRFSTISRLLLRLYADRHPEGFVLRCAMLASYMREGSRMPECWITGDNSGRDPGGPIDVTLLHELMQMGYSQKEALCMPISRALWEVAVARESKGRLEIVNEAEKQALHR